MSDQILVPALGESVTEATVSKWLKNEGDTVNADEAIVELETDKVNVEVPAPSNGTLEKISVKEGQTVNVGALLGTVNSSMSSSASKTQEDKEYSPPAKKIEVAKKVEAPIESVKKEKIIKPIKLINEAMKLNGVKNPRVAVQALNPHAEFGTEEKDEIIPAIELAKSLGINADGPLPCDTSFITAFKNKNYDCIVGMYHDALQSGLKAFGFDRGITVQGGLPIPITTPAHGTAFDIAGKNKANLEPTLNSFKIALTMAENKLNEQN